MNLAHGVARHVRPDGLRFAEIFAAPNGGKAAVLLRMSRESLKRNLRRETAGRRPCILRAIRTHGEAAQAENVPNISAVNRNGQQTAMRDPQRQGYAGDGPARVSSRVSALRRRREAYASQKTSGEADRRQESGAPFSPLGGRVERKDGSAAASISAEDGNQRNEYRRGEDCARARIVFKKIQRGGGQQPNGVNKAVCFHRSHAM